MKDLQYSFHLSLDNQRHSNVSNKTLVRDKPGKIGWLGFLSEIWNLDQAAFFRNASRVTLSQGHMRVLNRLGTETLSSRIREHLSIYVHQQNVGCVHLQL